MLRDKIFNCLLVVEDDIRDHTEIKSAEIYAFKAEIIRVRTVYILVPLVHLSFRPYHICVFVWMHVHMCL